MARRPLRCTTGLVVRLAVALAAGGTLLNLLLFLSANPGPRGSAPASTGLRQTSSVGAVVVEEAAAGLQQPGVVENGGERWRKQPAEASVWDEDPPAVLPPATGTVQTAPVGGVGNHGDVGRVGGVAGGGGGAVGNGRTGGTAVGVQDVVKPVAPSPPPSPPPPPPPPPTASTKSLSAYIDGGGRLPILLVTCNRAALLRRTLTSLLSVRGVTREAVFVVQDGAAGDVAAVVNEFGLRYHQKVATQVKLRGGRPPDGAERISQHYKYSLSYMFQAVTTAPAIIVVEDDFLFAPDFYEYFHAVAPVVEADPSVWLASAWHDNGFAGIATDAAALRRTSYFPGLGWLLPRDLFLTELAAKWPKSHWDHWMRDARQHRDRDVIIPEMPRDYHIGVKGTFMDASTHNKYFRDIAVNVDASFRWDTDAATAALRQVTAAPYDGALRQAISGARALDSAPAVAAFSSGVGVVWYSASIKPVPTNRNQFRYMAAYFGVWHEGVRGARRGVHMVRWVHGSTVYLVNVGVNKDLLDLKPAHVKPLEYKKPAEMEAAANSQDPTTTLAGVDLLPLPALEATSPAFSAAGILPEVAAATTGLPATTAFAGTPLPAYDVVPAPAADMSCTAVCAASSQRCVAAALPAINKCKVLSQHFGCSMCQNNYGPDQPAFLVPSSPSDAGMCLLQEREQYFGCDGKHKATRRLCPCA